MTEREKSTLAVIARVILKEKNSWLEDLTENEEGLLWDAIEDGMRLSETGLQLGLGSRLEETVEEIKIKEKQK